MAQRKPRGKPGRRRDLLGIAALMAVAAGFALAAQRFARIGVWAGALLASALALAVGLYVVLRAWPNLPRPGLAYQITRQGSLYIGSVFVVAVGALASANNLLFLVLACMLAGLLVSGLFSRLNLAELELQCGVAEHVFAGQEVPARLLLRNLKTWMPSFSIRLTVDLPSSSGAGPPEVYFPMIAGGQTCTATLSLRFPRRGRYLQDTFWLHSGFPFGFVLKSVRLRLPREILVYPAVAPSTLLETSLPRLTSQWETHQAGLGQDLYRIRPYQTGDSSRAVHWKASAHTGELKVREFTREEDRRVDVLFDCSIPPGEEWPPRFEQAVDACASLVWRLHSMGAGLRFTYWNAPWAQPERLENIYDILRYLAPVAPAEGGPSLPVEPSGMFQVIFTWSAARLPLSLPESSYYCYSLENL